MAVTMEIAGVVLPVGVGLKRNTLRIEQEYGGRSMLSCVLLDEAGTYRPEVGQTVELYEDAVLKWAGVVDEPREKRLGPSGALAWEITATDNHALADRRTVPEAFDRQYAGVIVTWIIDNVLVDEGITAGTIENGPEVGPVVSPYLYASQLLNEIAETTGMQWRINHDKTLDFFTFGLDSGAAIDESSDILANSVRVWRDRSECRNRQVLRGITGLTIEQTETPAPKPDGSTRTFVLRFDVAQKPEVYINTVQVDPGGVGILGLATGMKWYWNKGSNLITQDTSETELTVTDTLEIKYYGQYRTTVVLDDPASITERLGVEGGSGIYEMVDDAPQIEGTQAAMEKAMGMLRRFARISTTITMASQTIEFKVGEIRSVSFPTHDVSGDCLVMSVSAVDRPHEDNKLLYQATLVDGEAVGGWVNFFRTWLEKNRDLSIRADEVVQLMARLQDADMQDINDDYDIYDANPPFQFDGSAIFAGNIVFGRWQWLDAI